MDLSALIFVALAVAWAVYLVPKALRQHEEDAVSRTVEGFSDRLRVLARREAVSASEATLVPAGRTKEQVVEATVETEEPAAPTPAPRAPRLEPTDADVRRRRRAQQAAARRATERRRRVFNLILLAIVVVAALGFGGVIGKVWLAGPLVLMAAWLVACRLMVRSERASRASTAPTRKVRRTLADEALEAEDQGGAQDDPTSAHLLSDDTDEIPAVTAEVLDQPDGWTPVPVTLPTYVAKETAGRSVRTIDLDSTGVWSSGRNEADSQLAREAGAQRAKAESDADVEQRRASGS